MYIKKNTKLYLKYEYKMTQVHCFLTIEHWLVYLKRSLNRKSRDIKQIIKIVFYKKRILIVIYNNIPWDSKFFTGKWEIKMTECYFILYDE